jgi:hypothetical protein
MGTKMSFEGKIYYGVAGAEATNLLENTRDISYDLDPNKGETTVRGNGNSPPIGSSRVTEIGAKIEFTMLEKDTDAFLEAIKVAAAGGQPIALRTKSHVAGKGFNGDVNVGMKHGMPIKGEQTIVFTCDPNNELRESVLHQ